MMDLTFLRTFLAIYRRGSITHAARALHLTQPAVSQHLKALEAQLGTAVFYRHARGVRPTPAGNELARAVGPHLDALESVSASLAPESVGASGTVQLGGPADLLATKALPALAGLADAGLRIVVQPGLVAPLIRSLVAGDLDLLIAADARPGTDLTCEPLFEEVLVLVASPRWAPRLPPLSQRSARIAVLTEGPFVAFVEDMPIVRRFFAEALGVTLEGRARVVVPDLRAVAAAVRAGAGASVIPRHLVSEMLASGELVELLAEHPPVRSIVHLVSRPGATRVRRVAAVRNTLLRAAVEW